MKQTTKFYITSFLKNQTYFTPILIIFLQIQSLTYQQIFWVFTIGSIFSFLIEIPTGTFADIYGKRKSIIISKLGILISYIVFGFSSTFIHFIIAQILYEFGNAFRSGTETAYTYDYLLQNKNNPSYTEVKGKQKFYARIGESLATAIGGIIAAKFGFNWVFFIAAIPAFFNLILALSWEKIKEHEGKVKLIDSFNLAKSSFYEIIKENQLLRITINITLFTGVLAAIQKFIQPYMTNLSIPIEYFGFIYAFALIIAAFSVRYSYIIENKYGTIKTINTLSLLAVIPAIILGFNYIAISGIILFFLIIIIENIRSPIANNEFHMLVKSKSRATMGSILELSKSAGKISILPIAGYFADAFSMYISILIMAIILLINGTFFYIKKK